MKILALCGDYWHPASVSRAGLATLVSKGYEINLLEETTAFSKECLVGCWAVILAKGNKLSSADDAGWMTESIQETLSTYVRSGGGLLAIHSGTAGYEQAGTLRGLLGGVFSHHPAQCPVTVFAQAGHQLTEGVLAPFTINDEHYFMALDDPKVDIFATTRSEHGEQTGAWRRAEGIGRVAVLTPGHNLEVWLQPSFQTLIRNTLQWCTGITS